MHQLLLVRLAAIASDEEKEWEMRVVFFVTASELLKAACFPEQLVFDATCKTNQQALSMMFVVGACPMWHNLMFGKIFSRGETAENFSYIWKIILPIVYGDALKLTTIVMTDGDQWMCNTIDQAIKLKLIGTEDRIKRKRCYYHAVIQTFQKYYHYRHNDGGKDLMMFY